MICAVLQIMEILFALHRHLICMRIQDKKVPFNTVLEGAKVLPNIVGLLTEFDTMKQHIRALER